MIQTIYSNSYEFLRRVLVMYVSLDRKKAVESGNCRAFVSDTIVTPTEAVRDDLMRAFADEKGIASNLNLVSFSSWFGDSLGPTLMGRGNTAEELEWMIWTLLNDREFLAQEDCKRLKKYVGSQTPATVTALARRITHLFVTYISYRLDWVLEWMDEDFEKPARPTKRYEREYKVLKNHPDYLWQKAMFREIARRRWGEEQLSWSSTEPLFAVPKRWKELIDSKATEKDEPVHIFVPATLPPLALPFLQALAKTRDIYIYLINPCEAYWFETLPKSVFDDWKTSLEGNALDYLRRNAASQRALIERIWTFAGEPETDPSIVEDDLEERHTQQGANRRIEVKDPELDLSALENLRASDAATPEQTTAFVHHPECTTVLEHLQEAVLTDNSAALAHTVSEDDDSFLIVKAPNAAREIEAVLDWVDDLSAKAKKKGEKFGAEDVLVVTPDIDAMAPVISSVLMNRDPEHKLAYHIAGQSQIEVNSTAQAILAVGRFIFSKAAREDFEALLDYPIVLRSWGCDEGLTSVVRTWLVSAGYRWGFDDRHANDCVERGLAQTEGREFEGTLERALERLLLGARMQADAKRVYAQTLPMAGNEADGFDTVAGNKELFDFLCSIAQTLTDLSQTPRKQSATEWLAWTHRLIAEVFPKATTSAEIANFSVTAERVQEAVHTVLVEEPIEFEAFWGAISATLQTGKTMARASGRITFAGMQDFRWLPFKAIAAVGMNDGPTFPGVVRSEEFDLMTAQTEDEKGEVINARRRGDRDSRQNNRNVFLDLLLSCRKHFLVSYTIGIGKVEKSPSVVVQDLKTLLAQGLGDEALVERHLTVKLPTSVFAEANFTPQGKSVRSRNHTRLEALELARQVNFLGQQKKFLDTSIVAPDAVNTAGQSIALSDLSKIVTDPDAWAYKVLGISSLTKSDALDVSLKSPMGDALTDAIVQRDIAARLEAGESAREILQAYELNPTMGMAGVRGAFITKYLGKLVHVHGFTEKMKSTAVIEHMPAQTFESTQAQADDIFKRVVIPAADLYQVGDDKWATIFVAKSGTDYQRAMIQFLGRAAVRPDCGMYVITTKEKDEDPPIGLEYWQVEEDKNDDYPLSALEALLSLANHLARGPMSLASTFENGVTYRPLWVGDETRETCKRKTENLTKALKNLDATFYVPIKDENVLQWAQDEEITVKTKVNAPKQGDVPFMQAVKPWEEM